MGKVTKKSSAQLEIGSGEWTAARSRELAEEAKRKAAEEAERIRQEEEAARKNAEAERELLHRETAAVTADGRPGVKRKM
ncbi:hypothetical protein KWH45_04270 [Xanthomonas campestris pv. mirabilis]|uniref:hypothetical protein n=1 Tax=Xanthomonas euvesicatoria TaxID=456327 RepID=UPI001C44D597|nr:hypothetical protein [Xanthomonas euvesicatoria]MBV6852664.1 hypothetical protein [Xanthomonas campestris pv. mirabilis]